mmetsp:Transcript_13157/g.40568  ORF Transcript_13157/g.40568 Transcript_13157/m.40568 type:complete len:301 (+) Transcript_13157:70-972(+)
MSAQSAQRPRGGACTLQRLWSNADLADHVVAYLPLPAIAKKLPILDRRFRDEHLPMLGRLARRHKTLRASTTAFLDEIRASGRDLRLARFDASDLSAWEEKDPRDDEPSEHEMSSVGGVTCLQITRTAGRAHGGLELPFDLGQHRVNQIRYKFRFNDSLPLPSFGAEGFAFAYFSLACLRRDGLAGLMVEPSDDGSYALRFHMMNDEDEEENERDVEENGITKIATVDEGTWYSVTMVFNWETRMVRVGLATPGRRICEKRLRFVPSVIQKITMYNYSASVSCFAEIEILYPLDALAETW